MSRLLEYLQRVHAFNPTPRQLELGQFHVSFDELQGVRSVEARVDTVLRSCGRIALIGRSGCGKSSVIWGVLSPLAEGIAPISVPIAAMPVGSMIEPVTVADQLIRVLAQHAERAGAIDEGRQREILHWAQAQRCVPVGRDVRGRFGHPWLGAELAVDLRRQSEGTISIGPDEKLEVVEQLLAIIARRDLVPVLVFDDTDRWIDGLGLADPQRLVEGFFGRVLRWAAELDCAVVVAAHTDYFVEVGSRRRLLGPIETQVDVPRLPREEALNYLFERRLAWFCDDTEFQGARAEDVFEAAAISALYRWYHDHEVQLRDVVSVAHVALAEACDAASERITMPLISAAVSAR